jgi:tetratricopeptide (TPR) repeat protein
MRIRRSSGHFAVRRHHYAGGCLSFMLVMGIMAGVAVLAWDWLALQFRPAPTSQEAIRAEMQTRFNEGDFSASLAASQALLATNADDWHAHAHRIRTLIYHSYVDYAYQSDRQRALILSEVGLQRHPDDPAWQAIHAYALQANGRAIEASRLALRVIEREPDNVPARLALSGAYGGQGLFDAALRDASKAVELANRYAPASPTASVIDWRTDALRAVAIAFSDLGRYDEARSAITRAINLHRRLIPLHFEAALFAQQVGDADSATAAYFNIIAFDSENAKAHLRLCEVSSKLGERDVAIEYCQQATQYAPSWWQAWYQLGREAYLWGDFSQAVTAMNRCTTLQVVQEIPIEERELDCWYIQGQAAEVLGDCRTLMTVYTQFQAMRDEANLAQVWTYPPEGPAICTALTATPS